MIVVDPVVALLALAAAIVVGAILGAAVFVWWATRLIRGDRG